MQLCTPPVLSLSLSHTHTHTSEEVSWRQRWCGCVLVKRVLPTIWVLCMFTPYPLNTTVVCPYSLVVTSYNDLHDTLGNDKVICQKGMTIRRNLRKNQYQSIISFFPAQICGQMPTTHLLWNWWCGYSMKGFLIQAFLQGLNLFLHGPSLSFSSLKRKEQEKKTIRLPER